MIKFNSDNHPYSHFLGHSQGKWGKNRILLLALVNRFTMRYRLEIRMTLQQQEKKMPHVAFLGSDGLFLPFSVVWENA